MGQERRGLGQVGQRQYRIPLDWRNYDATQVGEYALNKLLVDSKQMSSLVFRMFFSVCL